MAFLAEILPQLTVTWDVSNQGDPKALSQWSTDVFTWNGACGHQWQMSVRSVVRGATCPYCAGRRVLPGFNDLPTTDPEVANQWLSQDSGLSPQDVSRGSRARVTWQCKNGHTWVCSVKNRTVLGRGCPVCAKKRVDPGTSDLQTMYPSIAGEWAQSNSLNPNQVSAYSGYVAQWVCSSGHIWSEEVSKRTYSGHNCPVCAGKQVLIGFNDLATNKPHLAAEWNDSSISPQEVTTSSRRSVQWKCSEGHEWTARIDDRTRGRNCPQCAYKEGSSKGEQELLNYVIELMGTDDVERNNRTVLHGRELDIYIPSLRIAIEFNGLYWHSEQAGKDKSYHYQKWKDCLNAGVQLITIWEDDWRDRRTVVQEMLAHKLGKQTTSVNARSCQIVRLAVSDAQVFMLRHHIQGFASGTYYLGLEHLGELVAVMIIRRDHPESLTLVRYAASCNVRGGQSKLLAWVQRNIDYEKLTTFADHEVSNGNLYTSTGWMNDGDIDPDYKYVYQGKREHKFNFRKDRFLARGLKYDNTLTERELAELNGLLKVWDCGKTRYVKHKS